MATRGILIAAWVVMVLLTLTQQAGLIAEEDLPGANKFFAGLIFIIGAPIFCAYTALSGILDYLLPEDWEDKGDWRK